jgi:hypothetical protein
MITHTPRPGSFGAQLADIEREEGPSARTGLMMVRFFLLKNGRTETDVIGLTVGLGIECREVFRRPRESVDELEERANPGGSWSTYPAPIFCVDTRALTAEEWAEAVHLAGAGSPLRHL